MTNGDWIRSMTDEELEKYVISACRNYAVCWECPMLDSLGRCVAGAERSAVLEWLESEHEERPVHADAPQEEHKGPEPGNIRDAALEELFS